MLLTTAGGLIIASNKTAAKPLVQTGEIPAVKRLVLTLRQAGIFPIVVLTGAETYEVRHQLTDQYVIFLEHSDFYESDMFTSIVYGIRYLQNKCTSIVITPVNSPLFRPDTVISMLRTKGDVIIPSYGMRAGHPVLLRQDSFEEILSYQGNGGLRQAMQQLADRVVYCPTEDPGIFSLQYDQERIEQEIDSHNQALLHPRLNIRIGHESTFFDERMKLLLYLIEEMQNVKQACDAMALSGGKAWNMINTLEDKLGYKVVERRQGGSKGGKTSLTDQGRAFLFRYLKYEADVRAYAQEHFDELMN